MPEVSIVLASVRIDDGPPLGFSHAVLVASAHEWSVALFETRPVQMARELCRVTLQTVDGESLQGMARAERAATDGRFLLLAGWGTLEAAEAGVAAA
jgi:hypothetical protein